MLVIIRILNHNADQSGFLSVMWPLYLKHQYSLDHKDRIAGIGKHEWKDIF